jgi:hypothetical protein
MQLSKPPKPKATRKRLKKEILSDDFKKRKIFWKNIAENFLENFPYGKIFHLTSLFEPTNLGSSGPVRYMELQRLLICVLP